jgi:hypothetical protein
VIGGTDELLYSGPIQYTAYGGEEFYQIYLQTLEVYTGDGDYLGEIPIPSNIDNGTGIIVDTGTTVMVMEQQLFNGIQKLITSL